QTIGLVADGQRNAVAVAEAGAVVGAVRAAGDDVGLRLSDVGAQPGGGLDANQRLLRPVEKGIAPLDGGCRPLHRIKRSRLVTDQDAVGRTCRWRRLESRLPG